MCGKNVTAFGFLTSVWITAVFCRYLTGRKNVQKDVIRTKIRSSVRLCAKRSYIRYMLNVASISERSNWISGLRKQHGRVHSPDVMRLS